VNADENQTQELNIIIKANTHGSAEAVSASIQQLSSKSVITNIVHIGVGDISEADVMLAIASKAIIIGFSVKEDNNAMRIAEQNKIDIRKYEIIYEILEDIEKTMLGLLTPKQKSCENRKSRSQTKCLQIGKTMKIAGCMFLMGKSFA
jgi:translation initiation factor IF-2